MAYIALYRKWRPLNFEDVVGQSQITTTLQKAIETDKVAHAYLFSGPRGTGKTSTAKIFARAMNCVHGPTPHPCNQCEVCRHIMSGESLDVVEIDAASNRSIEDIRTLRETIKFMPAEGKKKIYIIDEVHMLTTEAFNALLKTLEEPPAHVIFILATTEPERIPMTILSRCQRYEFRRITSKDIAQRLLYVAGQEGIDLTPGAAHILAVQADGGMRDALSMLDQCVSNTQGKIDEALVRDLLGLIGKDWLFALTQALFTGRGDVIIQSIDEVIQLGKEPQVILTELLAHLRALMLCQADAASDTLSAYADCRKELEKQAQAVRPEAVFQVLGILQQALLTAKTSPVPRIAVEMGLLQAARQMVAPPVSPSTANNQVSLEKPMPVEQTPPMPKSEQAVPPTPNAFVNRGTSLPVLEDSPQDAGALPKAPVQAAHQRREPVLPESPAPPVRENTPPASTPSSAPERQALPAGDVSPAQYQEIWRKMCALLNQEKKKSLVSLLRQGHVCYIGQGQVIATLQTGFMVKMASREQNYQFADAALTKILGRSAHLQVYVRNDPELQTVLQEAGQIEGSAEPQLASKPSSTPASQSQVAPGSREPRLSPAATKPSGAGLSAPIATRQKNVPEIPPGLDDKEAVPLPEEEYTHAIPPQEDIPLPEEEYPPLAAVPSPAWQPVTFTDISAEERAALEPLLKSVGDCNIYIETKK